MDVKDQLEAGGKWGWNFLKDVFTPVVSGIAETVTTGNPIPLVTGTARGIMGGGADMYEAGKYGIDNNGRSGPSGSAAGQAGGGYGANGQPMTQKERTAASGVSTQAYSSMLAVANAIQSGKTYQGTMSAVGGVPAALAAAQAKGQYAQLNKYGGARATAANVASPAALLPSPEIYNDVRQQRIEAMQNAIRANQSFTDAVNAGDMRGGAGLSGVSVSGEGIHHVTEQDFNAGARYGTQAGANSYEARIQSGAIQTQGAVMSSTYAG